MYPLYSKEPGPISRSSPVVTRPTRARAHSNSRARNVLRPRTKLTISSENELKDFWTMVLRYIDHTSNHTHFKPHPLELWRVSLISKYT